MTIEAIAKTCHAANRAFCEGIGDLSQCPWDEAEQWQRDSAVQGVEFRVANPNASPSEQHDRWTLAKLADGWKHGPVKDTDKKEHPCLIPYDELPVEQWMKDALFIAVVNALAPLL